MRVPSPRAVALACCLSSLGCSTAADPAPSATGGSSSGGRAGSGGSGAASGTGGDGTGGVPDEPPRWEVEEVTPWRGAATAAYTMFYDDTCNAQVDNQFDIADPELTARGMRASFGAIAGDCAGRALWTRLATLASHGHEIANHSWSHPNLTMSSVDVAQEIDAARTSLETNLAGYEVTFFIFPFDAFNDDLVDHLRAQGYFGARAGERGLNQSSFADDFRIQFDVFGPGYSIYAEAPETPCAAVELGTSWSSAPPACRQYVLDQYVTDIIAQGGWGIRELHSVDGEAWEPVPLEEYIAHLDFVESHMTSGALWVAPASDVIRYRRAREHCPLPPVSGDWLLLSSAGTLASTAGAECSRFATELTYVVRPLGPAPSTLSAQQGSAALEVEPRGDGSFLVTAHPAEGPVRLLLP